MEAGTVSGVDYTRTRRERLAGAFVLVVLVLACVTFWIGVPLGTLWALSKATDDGAVHFVGGLIGVPVAMALFSPVLFWLNGLYLRVTGHWGYDSEEDRPRRLRGPLEPLLVWSLLAALVLMTYWFFFLADGPGHLGP